MTLYLSFEQEAIIAQLPNHPPNTNPSELNQGYIVVADAELYDGPGAKHPPGNILAFIGPIEYIHNHENATKQLANLLKQLGHETLIYGEDF